MLYVIVYVLALHFAYKVTLDEPTVKREPERYVVPVPSLAVFHPLKVYPASAKEPVFAFTVAVCVICLEVSVGTVPLSAELEL